MNNRILDTAKYGFYIALPLSEKGRLPISLWSQVKTGKCAACGTGVLFHEPAFKISSKRMESIGKKLVLACEKCAVMAHKPGQLVIASYHPEILKQFDKLTAKG